MVGGDLRVFLLCHLGPSSFLFTLHFRQNLNNKRITKRVLYILKSCSPAIGGFFFNLNLILALKKVLILTGILRNTLVALLGYLILAEITDRPSNLRDLT